MNCSDSATERCSTRTTEYCTQASELPISRRAVANDLGQAIPEVDLDYFDSHILPPLPTKLDLDQVVKKLETDKYILRNRWAVFHDDPKDMPGTEDQIFSRLILLVEGIVSTSVASLQGVSPLFEYKSRPKNDMSTIYEKKPSKPDGYFVPVGTGRHDGRMYWYQVGVPGEYKPKEQLTDCIDNRLKTVWNMYQQLREDPRRRFALAYSIENTTTRIWFCNRSEMLVSTSFNFVTDVKKFVSFVLRLAYAKEHEIGWDTSMRLLSVPDNKPVHELLYEIIIHSAKGPIVYHTKKLLSDIGARSIRGRGTRVWKAVKLENNVEAKAFVALKDSWVDANRTREAEIMEKLRTANATPQFLDVIKTMLLTVSEYGDVRVEGQLDHTRHLHTNGIVPPKNKGSVVLIDTATGFAEQTEDSRVMMASKKLQEQLAAKKAPISDPQKNVTFHEKQHHRVVFEEVGSSLYEQEKPDVVFQALSQVASAMQAIHTAGPGWVHRDLSAGNILIISEEQPARIVDFEYAKELNDHTSHEVRTGTAHFIAAEADLRMYRYLPKPDEPNPKKARVDIPVASSSKPMAVPAHQRVVHRHRDGRAPSRLAAAVGLPNGAQASPPPVFFHNALHDMESLLWIALWFLLKKQVKSCIGMPATTFDAQKQRVLANRYFYVQGERLNFMNLHQSEFREWLQDLHPAVQDAAQILEEIRKKLVQLYMQIEGKRPLSIGKDVALPIYEFVSDRLFDAADGLARNEVLVEDLKMDLTQMAAVTEPDVQVEDASANSSGLKRKVDEAL